MSITILQYWVSLSVPRLLVAGLITGANVSSLLDQHRTARIAQIGPALQEGASLQHRETMIMVVTHKPATSIMNSMPFNLKVGLRLSGFLSVGKCDGKK